MDSSAVVNKFLNRIEYFYILLVIVWPTLSAVTGIGGAGKVVISSLMISVLKLMMDRKYRNVLLQVPVVIWGLWILYIFIQFGIMHHSEFDKDIYIYYSQIFSPFLIMTITVRDIVNGRINRIINILFLSFYVFSILSFFSIGAAITEDNRTSVKGVNDFNDVSFACCFCIFILVMKYWMNRINIKKLAILFIPLFYIIMQLASRTALAIVFVIIMTSVVEWIRRLFLRKITVSHIILISGCLCLFLLVSLYIGKHSYIFQRVIGTKDQVSIDTGTVLDMMGDRGPFYYFGFLEFLNNPIFGIGLKNFGPNGVYRDFVCHTEYMVNMAETGIVGMTLFYSFIISLIVTVIKTPGKYVPFPKIILWLSIFIPMFIGLFFWTYDRIYVFIFYAFIVGFHERSAILRSCEKNEIH